MQYVSQVNYLHGTLTLLLANAKGLSLLGRGASEAHKRTSKTKLEESIS